MLLPLENDIFYVTWTIFQFLNPNMVSMKILKTFQFPLSETIPGMEHFQKIS